MIGFGIGCFLLGAGVGAIIQALAPPQASDSGSRVPPPRPKGAPPPPRPVR